MFLCIQDSLIIKIAICGILHYTPIFADPRGYESNKQRLFSQKELENG